jgi:RND family efflux transporter MFP subunit
MKRLLIVLAGLLLVAGLGAGYWLLAGDEGAEKSPRNASDEASEVMQASDEEGEDSGETSIPVNVVAAEVGSVSTYLTASANLVPEDEVKVLAEAEGRVTKLLVEEGDRVEAGQLLAALLHDDAEIEYNKAELKAANARMAYERGSRAAEQELISREESDKIEMDHRIAQQELAEARWTLEKTEIRAPFAGRVTWRNVTLGQHIRPGDELFTVTDFDPLVSRIYLSERDVIELQEGREVDIALRADESVRFRGRICRISPVVDTATGTVKVTIEAIDPPHEVRPGGFVIIDIVRETHADTLVLPRQAVIRELQSAHVFVAKDGTAEKREVRVGLEEEANLEILSGLVAGERIVVAGQGSLKNGSRIKVLADGDASASAADEADDRRAAVNPTDRADSRS